MAGERMEEMGLSAVEAAERLKLFGPNELPHPDRRGFLNIAIEVVTQPMFALLLLGSLVYVLLGERLDATVLGLFATLSISISIIQENRSERVLESLRALSSPRALVLRDGIRCRLAARDLVPGDIVILTEGDRIPADATLLSGDELLAEESLLTGESMPVSKTSNAKGTNGAASGENSSHVFAGTLIVRGSATALVTATGPASEMGKIGQSLRSIHLEQPRLQRELSWLVRYFAIIGTGLAALLVLMLALTRGSWLQAALGGIAVGMSVMPEEIPLVLAVFMAMGAWRISRAGVLTRRAAAIETLGSATVLCTDKTGTLTLNQMRVEIIVTADRTWQRGQPLDEAAKSVLQAALGASAPLPLDPMDLAVHQAALEADLEPVMPQNLMHSYGLRPEMPATTYLWKNGNKTVIRAYAKGAPEKIADLCRLAGEARVRLMAQVDQYAAQGVRLLGVARRDLVRTDELPPAPDAIDFCYSGLVGFADPLRENVPVAVRECRSAGIRVVMITGDYPATAAAIAAQAGISNGAAVLTGDKLETMSAEELSEAVRIACVFARVRPNQKLRLVEALKRDGEIVAMTGDGVNDAPAMKAAHIGIAMGGRGTDVAREASSLVLLHDDFASIVSAIRLGRRIYDNLRKSVAYIVAVHIPIAGLALLPLVIGSPLMLMPIQIALLEMVIDPACSVVFEAERAEDDVMARPPRAPGATLLPRRNLVWAALQGLVALGLVAGTLLLGIRMGLAEDELRALVFTVLVLVNLGLILVNRSFHSSFQTAFLRTNRALWLLAGGVLFILTAALYWPPAQALFHFGPLHLDDLFGCLLVGATLILLIERSKGWFTQGEPSNRNATRQVR